MKFSWQLSEVCAASFLRVTFRFRWILKLLERWNVGIAYVDFKDSVQSPSFQSVLHFRTHFNRIHSTLKMKEENFIRNVGIKDCPALYNKSEYDRLNGTRCGNLLKCRDFMGRSCLEVNSVRTNRYTLSYSWTYSFGLCAPNAKCDTNRDMALTRQ